MKKMKSNYILPVLSGLQLEKLGQRTVHVVHFKSLKSFYYDRQI